MWCCLANNTNNCEESHYKEIRLSIRWSGMEVFFRQHTHQCLYIKLFFDFPSNRNFSSVRSLSNHCMLSLLIWYRPQTHKLVMWALWRPTKIPWKFWIHLYKQLNKYGSWSYTKRSLKLCTHRILMVFEKFPPSSGRYPSLYKKQHLEPRPDPMISKTDKTMRCIEVSQWTYTSYCIQLKYNNHIVLRTVP